MSRAKPVLVMSQFNGSARLKMAQLGWLSHFEPSRGITTPDRQQSPTLVMLSYTCCVFTLHKQFDDTLSQSRFYRCQRLRDRFSMRPCAGTAAHERWLRFKACSRHCHYFLLLSYGLLRRLAGTFISYRWIYISYNGAVPLTPCPQIL